MKPIIVSVNINKPKEVVWKAITEHYQMVQWFFEDIPNFKSQVGFTTEFNVQSGNRNFLHVWRVTEVVKNNKIVCEWKYPDYSDKTLLVTFEIHSITKEQTQFCVSALGIEYFIKLDIPEFTRTSCKEGWQYFTNRLQQFMA